MIKWIWSLALISLVCAQNATNSEVKSHESVQNSLDEKNTQNSEVPGIDKKKVAVLTTKPVSIGSDVHSAPVEDDNIPGSVNNPIQPSKYIGAIDENGLFLKYNYVFLTIASLSVVAVIVYKTHRYVIVFP